MIIVTSILLLTRLAQAKVATKDNIADFVKKSILMINYKALIKKSLITKRSILDVAAVLDPPLRLQNYLVFISTRRFYWISKDGSDSKIESWKFAGMSQESIKNSQTSDISFAPKLIGDYQFKKVELKAICLRQDSVSFLQKNVVNLYISYESDTRSRDLNTDFTLGNCLFGAVKLTKNDHPDKCRYSGFGIRFDLRSQFSWSEGSWSKSIIIFVADMSSSVHIDNKKIS